MKKVDNLYAIYKDCGQNEADKNLFFSTVRVMSMKLYYELQAKIFIEAQEPLYKHIAELLVIDCMKYFETFKISYIRKYVDEMHFKDEVPFDVVEANKARLYALKIDID